MRHLAMTGMLTASLISPISFGSLIRATPPYLRMSLGTRSSAITATAPASSATRAWSAVTTSMITPPASMRASPTFVVQVDRSMVVISRAHSTLDAPESPSRHPTAARAGPPCGGRYAGADEALERPPCGHLPAGGLRDHEPRRDDGPARNQLGARRFRRHRPGGRNRR